MKLFSCPTCSNTVHFHNFQCVNCLQGIGYAVDGNTFACHAEGPDGTFGSADGHAGRYRRCTNADAAGCNWLVDSESASGFCIACQLNAVIPDLTIAENRRRWLECERAKRRLLYSLIRLGRAIPEDEVRFSFVGDVENPDGSIERQLTGYADGSITINVAEADPAAREEIRQTLNEPYRTLIGHFRHEIGHYYFDRLVRVGPMRTEFNALFGDAEKDYATALDIHYRDGAPAGWQDNFISAYASAHPLEDFAETAAHVFHMLDGIETARATGLQLSGPGQEDTPTPLVDSYGDGPNDAIIDDWCRLSVAVNEINRSLGIADLYPFVLTAPVRAKLDFVIRVLRGH
jgi:hypothetical protein